MLSIIIVNFKNEEKVIWYAKEELSKILSPHITIIVNNAATDISNKTLVTALNAELITDISHKPDQAQQFFIISTIANPGFARANNLGVEFSIEHFDISHFLFSNCDIRFIDNNVVESLIFKLDSLQDVALIGPKIIGPNGRLQSPEPYYPFWKKYFRLYWLTPFLSAQKKKKLFELDYSRLAQEGEHYKIMGSFMIVKAKDFIRCGMMDSETFLYAEEVILSERLRRIGKKAYYDPEVSVFHEHGGTISGHLNHYQSQLQQFESESYYYQTYKGVSNLSIVIGRLSLKCYIKLRSLVKGYNYQ